MDNYNILADNMERYIGQTVTIFTASGGLSGNGFTGVLISVDCHVVRLLCDVGAPPNNPVAYAPYNNDCYYTQTGAISAIPISAIVSFTHNAL